MMYSENFKYDEIKVITEGNVQYCMPVMAFQPELSFAVNSEELYQPKELFKDWAENQKFPLYCSFELPNGVYSSYLFKVCTVPEKVFGVTISHFEYKGKNPSLSAMNITVENCPFDEILPVPNDQVSSITDIESDLKAKCAHLELLINGHITEIGMRKNQSGFLGNLNFHFPKYLYN